MVALKLYLVVGGGVTVTLELTEPMTNFMNRPVSDHMTANVIDPKTKRLVGNCNIRAVSHSCDVKWKKKNFAPSGFKEDCPNLCACILNVNLGKLKP